MSQHSSTFLSTKKLPGQVNRQKCTFFRRWRRSVKEIGPKSLVQVSCCVHWQEKFFLLPLAQISNSSSSLRYFYFFSPRRCREVLAGVDWWLLESQWKERAVVSLSDDEKSPASLFALFLRCQFHLLAVGAWTNGRPWPVPPSQRGTDVLLRVIAVLC